MGHSEDRAVRCLAVIRAPEGADVVGNDIEVDYDKDIIKDAPASMPMAISRPKKSSGCTTTMG